MVEKKGKGRGGRIVMKRLCTCLISMAISIDQIIYETKQKSKYKVDFNFIFIPILKKNI